MKITNERFNQLTEGFKDIERKLLVLSRRTKRGITDRDVRAELNALLTKLNMQ